MMSDQVISDLSRSLSRFMRLQSMMSSGRRISKPSDDPIGTQKDLRYRNVLTEIVQYKKNITNASNLLASYDNILGSMKDILSTANEVAISLANDTFDATARDAAANEVESLFNQIIALANTKMESRYIFSGYKTDTQAFKAGSSGVTFQGDFGIIEAEIEAATKVSTNLIGSDVLLKQLSILGADANLKVGVNGDTLLAELNEGSGIDLTAGTFVVSDRNLGINVTVDISGAATLNDVITLVNNQLNAAGIINLTLGLGLEGNNLRWEAVNNGRISASTLLSNVNGGEGVDLANGGIIIHNGDDTINVQVDLKSCQNIGDVINAINSDLATAGVSNVTAAINAAGTGIDIVDANGISLGLRVDELSQSAGTAFDLGILGSIAPTLSGRDLNPQQDFAVSEAVAGQTTGADLGLLGAFSLAKVGDELTPIITDTTSLSLLNNGKGLDLGQIKILQGGRFVVLNLGDSAYSTVSDLRGAFNNSGLAIEASINSNATGIEIRSTSPTETLKIEEIDGGSTAHDMGIFGSPDILGSMMILIDALRNDDQKVTAQIIGNLDKGIQALLGHRASVGAKVIRLETTDSRLTDMDFNFTKLLSEVEDADLTKLVTDLAMQENSYQSALIATAKIIQPSLLDFLE